jgi:hypothetical protein
VSPVKYELGFYIPEDDILHSHCRENLKSHTSKLAVQFLNQLLRTVELTYVSLALQACRCHSDRFKARDQTALIPINKVTVGLPCEEQSRRNCH